MRPARSLCHQGHHHERGFVFNADTSDQKVNKRLAIFFQKGHWKERGHGWGLEIHLHLMSWQRSRIEDPWSISTLDKSVSPLYSSGPSLRICTALVSLNSISSLWIWCITESLPYFVQQNSPNLHWVFQILGRGSFFFIRALLKCINW